MASALVHPDDVQGDVDSMEEPAVVSTVCLTEAIPSGSQVQVGGGLWPDADANDDDLSLICLVRGMLKDIEELSEKMKEMVVSLEQVDMIWEKVDILGKEMVEEEMVGEEMVGEEMVGEEMAGEEMAGEEMVGEEMVGEEMVGEEMVGEEMVGEEMVGEEMAMRREEVDILGEKVDTLGEKVAIIRHPFWGPLWEELEMLHPLSETAVGTGRDSLQLSDEASNWVEWGELSATQVGNDPAHAGDVVTDICLLKMGLI